jgi:hypothetical protein
MSYDSSVALRAMRSITQDAEAISLGDERTAEQAAMALDSLYIAYSKQANPSNASEVRSAINSLFQGFLSARPIFVKKLGLSCIDKRRRNLQANCRPWGAASHSCWSSVSS